MFKKLAVFTDIHFGLKSNSKLHNDDCEEFVDWYIDLAKKHGCETGMFCGDWHHNRNSVNITTMDASIRSLEKIGKAFDKFYFFPGNIFCHAVGRGAVKVGFAWSGNCCFE